MSNATTPESAPASAPLQAVNRELEALIRRALQMPYTSESCKDRIQTGNHYQSVKLGKERTKGFRSDRAEFLDQIDFTDAKVLDLGSNIGEMSRSARERGARLVDGFEYDAFFVATAQLINAYNETTRVSFYQRDITNPGVYSEHYDIVMGLSVFTYIQANLERIAEITDGVFILETHKLNENLEKDYIDPVLPYFPYYRILGESDWSNHGGQNERRAFLVFAKSELELERRVKASNPPVISVDPQAQLIRIDTKTTCLQEAFFAKFPQSSAEDLLSAVALMPLDLEAMSQDVDLTYWLYSGWSYWALYLRGYAEYRKTGTIGKGNTYYRYLVEYYLPRQHDPGLRASLQTECSVIARVAHRFRDLELLDRDARNGKTASSQISPVRLLVDQVPPPAGIGLKIFQVGQTEFVLARAVDGWHRLFGARLFGIEELPGEVIQLGTGTGRLVAGENVSPLESLQARDNGDWDEAAAYACLRSLPGTLDGISGRNIYGWAWDERAPQTQVDIEILAGERLIGTTHANLFREDLARAGIGDGFHAFSWFLPAEVGEDECGSIWARVKQTGARLPGAPGKTRREPNHGSLDGVTRCEAYGWAWDPELPERRLEVEILDGNKVLGVARADQFREDLQKARIGDGQYGFRFELPHEMQDGQPHLLSARVKGTSKQLFGSSKPLPPVRESAVASNLQPA